MHNESQAPYSTGIMLFYADKCIGRTMELNLIAGMRFGYSIISVVKDCKGRISVAPVLIMGIPGCVVNAYFSDDLDILFIVL